MKSIALFLIFLAAFGPAWPALASAESAPSARLLSWSDCVAQAAKQNPDLASSLAAREAGRASYKGSYNGLLPQVTLSNSYNDSSSPKGTSGSSYWQAEGAVSLNVFDAARIADVKTSKAALTQAEAALRQTSSNLRFSLRQAYAQLLFAEKSIDVSRSILERRKKNAQLVALRYDSGRESKGNMLRAKAQLLQATLDLNQALRGLRTTQKSLDRQLGLDDFSALAVTGPYVTPAPGDLPADGAALAANRPDVALQAAVLRGAEASLSRSRGALWPSLSAVYARTAADQSEFPSDFGWSFSGILSYPLFGGGPTAAYYSIEAAKRTLEKAREDLRGARNQAIEDIETSWSGFAGAVDQAAVQQALLEAARQRNDEADVRYASGLLTYDNWEIIASDRVNQERQAVQAQLNAMTAQAAWDKALGTPLGE